MAQDRVAFFDLLSRDGAVAWSINTWKTRFILNYKSIPYDTAWLGWSDLQIHFKACFDAKHYTLPIVRLPGGEWVMDSRHIADQLEQTYPQPSLYLDSKCLIEMEELVASLMRGLEGVYAPKIAHSVMSADAKNAWEKELGMTMQELESQRGGNAAYASVLPVVQDITSLLTANRSGPFVMGNVPSGFRNDIRVVWGQKFSSRLDRCYAALGQCGGLSCSAFFNTIEDL